MLERLTDKMVFKTIFFVDLYTFLFYTNLSDKDVVISPNQLITYGSMIFENKSKPFINVVKKGVKDPAVTERIWAELKLNENKILQKKRQSEESSIFNDK